MDVNVVLLEICFDRVTLPLNTIAEMDAHFAPVDLCREIRCQFVHLLMRCLGDHLPGDGIRCGRDRVERSGFAVKGFGAGVLKTLPADDQSKPIVDIRPIASDIEFAVAEHGLILVIRSAKDMPFADAEFVVLDRQRT